MHSVVHDNPRHGAGPPVQCLRGCIDHGDYATMTSAQVGAAINSDAFDAMTVAVAKLPFVGIPRGLPKVEGQFMVGEVQSFVAGNGSDSHPTGGVADLDGPSLCQVDAAFRVAVAAVRARFGDLHRAQHAAAIEVLDLVWADVPLGACIESTRVKQDGASVFDRYGGAALGLRPRWAAAQQNREDERRCKCKPYHELVVPFGQLVLAGPGGGEQCRMQAPDDRAVQVR